MMLISFILNSIVGMSPAPTPVVAAAPAPEPCILRPTHGTPLLLGEVLEQKVTLTGAGDCKNLPPGALLLVNSTDNARKAMAQIHPSQKEWELTVTAPIPSPKNDEEAISGTWSVYTDGQAMSAGGKPLAQLLISSMPVVVTTTTTAVYRYAAMNEAVAVHAKPPGTAYVLSPSKTTSTAAATTSTTTTATTIKTSTIDLKNYANLALSPVGPVKKWSVASTEARLFVDGADCGSSCQPASIRSLEFTVDKPSPLPIHALLTATRPNDETFTISARLADSTAHSSIPLNIADIVYLLCQKHVKKTINDVIRVNNLAAVTNSAVSNNLCKLVISEDDIALAIARQNKIPFTRHVCRGENRRPGAVQAARSNIWARGKGEERCRELGATMGEEVTLFEDSDLKEVEGLKIFYGSQRVTFFAYTDGEKKEASRRTIIFSSNLQGRREIAIDFGVATPNADKPISIEVYVQPVTAGADLPKDLAQIPERRFVATLRPKGPFGITHRKGSLGSKSLRLFVTIPVDFAVVRFPAAGLDIKSTRDSTRAQLSALTTGALLTFEPWDYTRGTNMYAVPMRFQAGMLMSNWYKGEFHPSTYLGYAITLPVFRGTSQLDTDLALGFGWEVDLRNGYDRFGHRNHLLITLGMNILSLFGPQSAPRK